MKLLLLASAAPFLTVYASSTMSTTGYTDFCLPSESCKDEGGVAIGKTCYLQQDATFNIERAADNCEEQGYVLSYNQREDVSAWMVDSAMESGSSSSTESVQPVIVGLTSAGGCDFAATDTTRPKKVDINWAPGQPNGNCENCDYAFDDRSDRNCCAVVDEDAFISTSPCVLEDALTYFCEIPLCSDTTTEDPDECVDLYDRQECKDQSDQCEVDDVAYGCAKTCGLCGGSDGDGDGDSGSVKLTFEECDGCEDFFGQTTGADTEIFDWEACFGKGAKITVADDSIDLNFINQDDPCGSLDPSPKPFHEFVDHSAAFRITADNNFHGLDAVLLVTANAGDGSLQVAYSFPETQDVLVLHFTIDELRGDILGYTEIPDGEPPLSDGEAVLVLQDYEDNDVDDGEDFCSDVLESLCPTLQSAMEEGDWSMEIDQSSQLYVHIPTECGVTDDEATETDINALNGAAFVAMHDTYLLFYLGNAEEEMMSIVLVMFEDFGFCTLYFSIEEVSGVFMGVDDLNPGSIECEDIYCRKTSCSEWLDLGVSQEDLVNVLDCDECADCLEPYDDYCDYACAKTPCSEMIENRGAEKAMAECRQCGVCSGDLDASELSTTTPVPDCAWWNC